MRILFAGDFCQCGRVDALIRERNLSSLFGQIQPIVGQSDYSVVNFEFPIVLDPSAAKPIVKQGPNLKGSVESVEAVKYAGFKACALANNHILDQGTQCCVDTKRTLESAGIDTVGAGDDLEEAAHILYKKIGGNMLALINCCEHEFSIATETEAGANPVNAIAQYYAIQEARKSADFVAVVVHGGHEYFQLPSPRMQELYRFFIDAGADAVVNHHQHCYSGYEVYCGKPIFYGLGNFCFDKLECRQGVWNEGFMVEINFEKGQDVSFVLHPYRQCTEELTVAPMVGAELEMFQKRMDGLNEVIQDKSRLSSEFVRFMDDHEESYGEALSPYSNKYMRALYKRGLLPSFLSAKKRVLLRDYIECESHLVRLIRYLRK